MEEKHQVAIWFFIGALLAAYGLIILATGVYLYLFPPATPTVRLAYLHADIWWGLLMVAFGAFYCVRYNPLRR